MRRTVSQRATQFLLQFVGSGGIGKFALSDCWILERFSGTLARCAFVCFGQSVQRTDSSVLADALFILHRFKLLVGVYLCFIDRLNGFVQVSFKFADRAICGIEVNALLLTLLIGLSFLFRRQWLAATLTFFWCFNGGGSGS